MFHEIRLTAHKRGITEPDYNEVHRRMAQAGFMRIVYVAGQPFHTLGGMYRSYVFSETIGSISDRVRNAMAGYPFKISYQVLEATSEQDFNLEPATPTPLSGSGTLAALLTRIPAANPKPLTPLSSALFPPKKMIG